MSVIKKFFVLTILSQLIFSQNFSISLNVSGGTSDYDLTIGFSPDASDDYDPDFDFFAPPAPPPPSFDAALFWNGDRYFTQIMAGDGDISPHEINIQLQYPEENIIQFNWDNSGWSDFGSIELRDAFGGIFVSVDMTVESNIQLTNPALTSLVIFLTPAEVEFNPLDFSVSFNVSGGTSDYDLTAGFSPNATDGYDPEFDFFAPPAPPPPSFDAALVWSGDRYYTQILAGDEDYSSHDINIQLQFPDDNTIYFSWDNTGWSELGAFEIMDAFGGTLFLVNMLEVSEFTLDNIGYTNLILRITPNGESSQNPFEGNVTPTPMSGIFQGQVTINEEPGTENDWIAAFDDDGNIAGASALIMEGGNSYVNFAIYGDDPLTEVDEGMNDGENFHLKIWIASDNTILDYPESFDCWYNNNGAPMDGCGDLNEIYNFGEGIEPPPVASLVINEIHYNPSSEQQGSDNMYEFLEIYNLENETVDLGGYTIALGIDAEFPSGSSIAPHEYIIAAKTPDTYSGNGYQVFQFFGNIYNAGEELELVDDYGRRVDYVHYEDEGDWPTEPDGEGPSLELINPHTDNENPENWGYSLLLGGTPGAENSIIPEDENIVITVDNVEAYEGYEITVPVTVHFPDGMSVNSADIELSGFSQHTDFIEITMDGSLPSISDWTVAANEMDESILIAMAGANSISGDGLLFSVIFILNDGIDVDFVPVNISSAVFNTDEFPDIENGGIQVLEPIPPTASFTADPTTGLFPLTVSFTNTSDPGTGNTMEFEWDFGTGESSIEENPEYTFELPGIYQVTLMVQTNHGEDISEPMEINVLALYGDVDMNDEVQSYDASLILQYLVGYIELDDLQILIGDVNLSDELTALDASYILQYLVGLIESLPMEGDVTASGDVAMEDQFGIPGETVTVPIQILNGENILSFESQISFDNTRLSFVGIDDNQDSDFSFEFFEENGMIKIAGATQTGDESDYDELVNLRFLLEETISEPAEILIDEIRWNENETILNPAEGQIYVMASDGHSVFPGWNLMSFDIELMENDPEIVFDELMIEDNLVSVAGYDENGSNFYDPFGYDFLNTLTSIDAGRGYWVKVNENDQFSQQGMLLEDLYSVNLWEGWSIIGYWLTENSIPEEAFAELIDSNNLVYATGFDEGGFSFYDPNGLDILNTLTTLENGFGYMLKLNEPVDGFQYPIPSGVMGREILRSVNPDITMTNSCMFVNGTISFQNMDIDYESKVSIFTENGLQVGEMEILEGGYLLTGAVYGDEKTTEILDGAKEGDRLIFTLGEYESEPTQIAFSGDMNLRKVDLLFSGVPAEFTLIGNFPNPFNPLTTIKYGLPKDSYVEITISNLLGKEVKSLVKSHQTAGFQSVVWNGKDNQDQSVSAGVYLYRIEAGEFVQTKKMVLLK